MKINISETNSSSPPPLQKYAYSKPSSPTQMIIQMQIIVLSPGRRQCEEMSRWQELRREGHLVLISVCTTKTTVYSSHLDTTVYFPLYFSFVEPTYCKLLLKTID